jgi:hypothetical protein
LGDVSFSVPDPFLRWEEPQDSDRAGVANQTLVKLKYL